MNRIIKKRYVLKILGFYCGEFLKLISCSKNKNKRVRIMSKTIVVKPDILPLLVHFVGGIIILGIIIYFLLKVFSRR